MRDLPWLISRLIPLPTQSASVGRIDYTLRRQASGYELGIVWHFAATSAHDARPLILAFETGSAAVAAVEAIGVEVAHFRQGGHSYVACTLGRDGDWDGSGCALSMRWQAKEEVSHSGACLTLPGLLGRQLVPRDGAVPCRSPRLHVDFEDLERGRGPALAGIQAALLDDDGTNAGQLQSILVDFREDEAPLRARCVRKEVLFTPSFARAVDDAGLDRVERLTSECLAWLTEELSVSPWARVVYAAPNDGSLGPVRGAFVPDLERHVHDCDTPLNARLWAGLVLRLSRVWWGGGCAICGRGESELVAAIAFALSLRMFACHARAAVLDPLLEEMRKEYRRHVGWRRLLPLHTRKSGPTRSQIMGAELYDLLRGSPGARAEFQRLTRRCWGMRTTAEHLRAELRALGMQSV